MRALYKRKSDPLVRAVFFNDTHVAVIRVKEMLPDHIVELVNGTLVIDGELEAELGEYVVRFSKGDIIILPQKMFEDNWELVK